MTPGPVDFDRVNAVRSRLEGMVGLLPVKEEVNSLLALAMDDRQRMEDGMPPTERSMHLIFSGAPGTGKTTVAREIGQLYNALGILPKDKVVEVSRADVVGGYMGQTAEKMREKFDQARGGVLFVDEAYAMAGDAYGAEAMTELLKLAEDNRGDTVVILAGYKQEMKDLMNVNPGLSRRFPTTLDFPSYDVNERFEIMQGFFRAYQYTVQGKAVRDAIKDALWMTGEGNAGDVRTLMEKIHRAHVLRIQAGEQMGGDWTKQERYRITLDDVNEAVRMFREGANVKQPLEEQRKPKRPRKPRKGSLQAVS